MLAIYSFELNNMLGSGRVKKKRNIRYFFSIDRLKYINKETSNTFYHVRQFKMKV